MYVQELPIVLEHRQNLHKSSVKIIHYLKSHLGKLQLLIHLHNNLRGKILQ